MEYTYFNDVVLVRCHVTLITRPEIDNLVTVLLS
jgi:hypothetical protein